MRKKITPNLNSQFKNFCANRMKGEVVNELSFGPVQRRDQDTLLVCEVSNNNITTPLSAAVQLDMICKYR